MQRHDEILKIIDEHTKHSFLSRASLSAVVFFERNGSPVPWFDAEDDDLRRRRTFTVVVASVAKTSSIVEHDVCRVCLCHLLQHDQTE